MLGGYVFIRPYDRILATDNTQNMWWDPALTYIQLTGTFWISEMKNS